MFSFLLRIYTYFLARKFYSFGKNSLLKPFLNSANEKYISVGNHVDVGSFCRLTVSTEFGGYKVKSKNQIRLKIGDHVDIGHNTFISANNSIEIGEHVIMAPYVFITDHDHGFSDTKKHLHEQPLTENGFVKIGKNVLIGTKSSILKNVEIGEHSVIGANSVVTKDVPSYSVVAGSPARIVKKYSHKKGGWL